MSTETETRRYCVNATVTVDAWVYVDADSRESAMAEAEALPLRDFELGDPLYVGIDGAEEEE